MDTSFENNTFLIDQLTKGNEKAYVYLVTHYHKTLYVYALSLTNDHDMSEDIVQNVFIRTWEFRRKLKKNHTIKGFLYKATYNEFVNVYHRKKAVLNLEKVYIEALNGVVDEKNTEVLQKKLELVSQEIEKLPKKCKRTLLLSKKEGLTNIEIAEYLDISTKSVEAHITKAYSIIRKNVKSKIKLLLFTLFNVITGKQLEVD